MMKLLYKLLAKVIMIWLICMSSLLFSSCAGDTEESPVNGPSASTAVYIIQGKVVNEENINKGIPGIQIKIIPGNTSYETDTLYTSSEGIFNWESSLSTFDDNLSLRVVATDTNHLFQSKETTISYSKDEISEALSQFLGEIKRDVLIKLKKNN